MERFANLRVCKGDVLYGGEGHGKESSSPGRFAPRGFVISDVSLMNFKDSSEPKAAMIVGLDDSGSACAVWNTGWDHIPEPGDG